MSIERRRFSLRLKQLTVFVVIILIIMGISLGLHMRTVETMRQMTYEKMKSKGDYYQSLLDNEIDRALLMQIEFLNGRKLFFLTSPKIDITPYEKREALLTVRERLGDITSPAIVEDAIVYFPQTGYKISPGLVTNMDEADREEMEEYCTYSDKFLNYDGKDFFSMRLLALGSDSKEDPSCVLVLTLSSKMLRTQLEDLTVSENSGAFFYNEDLDVLLENGGQEGTAGQILEKLPKDDEGNYQDVSRVSTGGKTYLVFAGDRGNLGVLIQYVEEAPIMEYIKISWRNMIVFLAVMSVLAVIFIWYSNKIIHKPMHILLEAFERVQQGNLEEKIHHKEDDEFAYLYQGFNTMEDRVSQLLTEVAQQTDLAQKAQLKQLQAQINPHFLYNSFFILSRRIKRHDYENAEEFAKHLGNYFKYLARDGADYIPLYQETEHAKSYAAIQSVRFSDRIRIEFEEVQEECRDLLVPRLILQPLLENAFKYGLENKVEGGLLRVSFRKEKSALDICVDDNGDDVTNEDILKMQRSLEEDGEAEVTGIVNISRRLKLYFKGSTGLSISRSSLGGVAARIVIPCGEEEEV